MGLFFIAIYENEEIQRPTFAEISPFSKFHNVRVRCLVFPHTRKMGTMLTSIATIISSLSPVAVATDIRAIAKPFIRNSLSTQKIRILLICINRSTGGNVISTFSLDISYEAQQLTEFKSNRIKMHAPYKI